MGRAGASPVRLFLIPLLFASSIASAQSFTFRLPSREVVIDLSPLPRTTIAIRDPTDGSRRKLLLGVSLQSLLAAHPAPAGADALAVRCDDGWLSLLPIATLRHRPLLALAESTARGPVALAPPRGPIFLAWPNADSPAVDAEVDPGAWAFAVASLEWVRLADFALPAANSPNAQTGRSLFAYHCQHCHALAGRGGIAGWDLSMPPILTYRTERYVTRYIADPRQQNPAAHMPAFKTKLTPLQIDSLVTYLRTLKP